MKEGNWYENYFKLILLLLLSRESEPFNNLIFELNYEYFDSLLVFVSIII